MRPWRTFRFLRVAWLVCPQSYSRFSLVVFGKFGSEPRLLIELIAEFFPHNLNEARKSQSNTDDQITLRITGLTSLRHLVGSCIFTYIIDLSTYFYFVLPPLPKYNVPARGHVPVSIHAGPLRVDKVVAHSGTFGFVNRYTNYWTTEAAHTHTYIHTCIYYKKYTKVIFRLSS